MFRTALKRQVECELTANINDVFIPQTLRVNRHLETIDTKQCESIRHNMRQ